MLEVRLENAPATVKAYKSRKDIDTVLPESLGNLSFRRDYGIRYNYLCGAMYKGISSVEMVVALGKAGLMGYLGTGGMSFDKVESSILEIQGKLNFSEAYGVNLLSHPENPGIEMEMVNLFIKHQVRFVEASAYITLSPAVVRYRLKGIYRDATGEVKIPNRVLAKVSRPEVAEVFMRPAPEKIIEYLLNNNQITEEEASLGRQIPVAQDICVESDSGGHTSRGNAYVLVPAIRYLRDRIVYEEKYSNPIYVGAAGGIGTPEAAAATFMLGADFIMTGSINQCTIEAGTSEEVKEILQTINVQDTDYAPAGDMFEIGAKVQVVKRGVFFPARANKLYDLYLRHNSLDELDEQIKSQIQSKYFKKSFDEVWRETRSYYERTDENKLNEMELNSKKKMAAVFRWYFIHTTRLALNGSKEQRVDYQIHCGPALGAFNQWVKGTELEAWKARDVANVAELIMTNAAEFLQDRMHSVCNPCSV